MHINIDTFSSSCEISSLRSTLFYKRLRPYIHGRLCENAAVQGRHLNDKNEDKISVEDRYFAKLDILFSEVFKNCKTRQFWKQCIEQLPNLESVSSLSIEALNKAYLNELVVLFERLGRFTILLKKAFKSDIDVTDLEVNLLKFFNPHLFTIRNYSHHRLYLGCKGLTELQLLEEAVEDEKSFLEYFVEYKKVINERTSWISYTEKEISNFIKNFFDLLHSKIEENGVYVEQKYLSQQFSILDKFDVDIRRQYKHDKIFSK